MIDMKTVCVVNQCAGCMACVDICPKNAIKIEDSMEYYNAVIDESKCVGCNACLRVCQQMCHHVLLSPLKWFQGWANNLRGIWWCSICNRKAIYKRWWHSIELYI